MISPSLTLLYCGAIPECRAVIHRSFEQYTLQLMTSGTIDLGYDEEWKTLTGRWFWFANPGPLIQFFPTEKATCWNHRYIVFEGPLSERWKAEGLLPNLAQPMPGDKDYTAVFDELLFHAKRTDSWGIARAVNLLEQMLYALAEARTQSHPAESWLLDTLEKLENREDFVPNYAQLAQEAGMGLSTFREKFKSATGKPMHVYVLEKRMIAARALLGETDLPLKEIATRLGYSDLYYFHRQFKMRMGVSPSIFRRSRIVR